MGFFDTPVAIRSDVLFRAGESTTNTGGRYYSKVIDYINRAHLDLCRGNNPLDPEANVIFKWALKHPPGIIRLEPKYDSGTVSATLGDSTITFSSVIANSVAGWHIKIDGEDDVFRINSHTAGTATANIDTGFTGTTVSAATFKLMKLEYEVGGGELLRLVSPFRVFQSSNYTDDYKIYGISPDKFDQLYPLSRIQSGIPECFKVVKTRGNTATIIFNRYLDTEYLKVEYDYTEKPDVLTTSSTTDDIFVPDEWRYIIADFALAMVLKDKSDDKYDDAVSKARAGFAGLVSATRYESNFTDDGYGHIISREDDFYNDTLLRTESGLLVGYIY